MKNTLRPALPLALILVACSSGSKAPARGAGGAAGTSTGGAAGATSAAGGATAMGGATGGGGASGGGGAGTTGAAGADAAVDGPTDAPSTSPDAGSDGGVAAVKGHPTPGKVYPTYDGFTLYLVEEFDQPLDLDEDPIWTWSDALVGATRMGEDAITFADGHMKITVSQGDTSAGYSVAKTGDVAATHLKGGELRTKYNMFRWGRYEASIKPPAISGNYILSMFTFRTPHYQEWREIDWELIGSYPKSVSTNIIIGDNMQGWLPTAEDPTVTYPFEAQPAMALPAGFDSQATFHTYAFEALPDHITYFVDGVPVRTKMTGVGKNNLVVPQLSMKAMMNHWVNTDSGFGGDPALNTYPRTGEYDWFRFYRWNNDPSYPCEPVPDCLPAADKDLSFNNPKEPGAPTGP